MNLSKLVSLLSVSLIALAATGCATSSPAHFGENPQGYHVNHDQTVARGGVGNYVFRDNTAANPQTAAVEPALAEKQIITKQAAPTRSEFNGKTIYFPSNIATLSTVQKNDLKALSKNLKANSTQKLEIAGFADSTGNPAKNMKLSQARAKNVAAFLKANGIPANRFNIDAYGETRSSGDKSNTVKQQERKTTITTITN
ncbi:MAG: OmpA family protein [Methylotenera sp.]|nr:OmpA family protein [Oligoflexia bacterium]